MKKQNDVTMGESQFCVWLLHSENPKEIAEVIRLLAAFVWNFRTALGLSTRGEDVRVPISLQTHENA